MSVTAADMVQALANHFGIWANVCAYNTVAWGYEADWLACSKAGYLTEVELKVSLSDLRADRTKAEKHWTLRHGHMPFKSRPMERDPHGYMRQVTDPERWDTALVVPQPIKRFYYCLPHELLPKALDMCPDHSGVMMVSPRKYGCCLTIERPAPVLPNVRKATAGEVLAMYRSMYARSWSDWRARYRHRVCREEVDMGLFACDGQEAR